MVRKEEARDSVFSTSNRSISRLLEYAHELSDVNATISLLTWDVDINMPSKGGSSRAKQISTLESIYYKKLTSSSVGRLLEKLARDISDNSYQFSHYDTALIREFKREYDRAIKLPKRLVKEITGALGNAWPAWRRAREEANFGLFVEDLKRLINLKLQEVEYVGYEVSPYDALLDIYEAGLTEREAEALFIPLKKNILEILEKIKSSGVEIKRDFLKKKLDQDRYWGLLTEILEKIGFDFEAGRQDISVHPFTCGLHPSDVRITTRFDEEFCTAPLFSSIHEGGHALYYQGMNLDLARTFLSRGIALSFGVHESQSRLWENFIALSSSFWEYWYPRWVETFPEDFSADGFEDFVRAINKVEPSFIRVDADEVTYNLHIILRFEIERDLIHQKIRVEDLPDIWNQKMKELLGIVPPDDAKGVLQDVQWCWGSFGYFPTYTLGNLYAAQIYDAALRKFSDFHERISRGEMLFLREWLRENIHQYGATYSPQELIRRVTGENPNPEYFRRYLESKFGEIYNF